nr:fusion protein [Rhizobium sp. Q54]
MATSYYSTGTVSLTNGSAVVTGNGTGWQLALISGGNVIVQAAGNLLPIASVDSDTQITAELQWTGETGEYAYTIQRDTAYLQSLDQNSQNLSYLLSELRAGTIFKYDQSGDLAGRDLYDARPKNFGYLVTIGVSQPVFYVKASNAEGDWAGPFPYGTGPVGPAPTIGIGTVTTLAPGAVATASVEGSDGEYNISFEIPAGLTGINPRGAYSSSSTYAERDAVLQNGSTWLAKVATSGNAPPGLPTTENTWWVLIAAKGLDGDGAGDMISDTYDPQNKQADAFSMENMDEGKFSGLLSGSLAAFGSPNSPDNAAAITAWLALASSKKKYVPTGVFSTSAQIAVSDSIDLEGDGMDASILSRTGAGGGQASLLIDIDAGSTGHRYRDFGLMGNVAVSTGMQIRLAAGAYMSNFEIDGVKVGAHDGWGLYLDNSVGNNDGFFVGTIRRSVFYNGVLAPNLGDSINFEQNQVTAGEAGANPAIYFEGVSGARQYIIRENNLTCRGGAIVLLNCDQARIENNQCEHGWWYGDGSYTGNVDAHIYLNGCLQPIIRGNTSNPFANFAKPVIQTSGLFTNGSNTINNLTDTSAILVGDKVWSTDGMLPATRTVTGKTTNSITMDGPAISTAVANVAVTRLINTNGASASIVIDVGCNEALIEDNDLAMGRIAHIIVGAGAKNTRIGRNRYYGSLTPTVLDSGEGTMGLEKEATLLGEWVPFDNTRPAKFTKGLDGRVRCSGAVKGGVVGSNLFTFPVGFRPSKNVIVSVASIDPIGAAASAGVVIVLTSGEASLYSGDVRYVSLEDIEFDAPLVP